MMDNKLQIFTKDYWFILLSVAVIVLASIYHNANFFLNQGFPDDQHNYDIEVHAYRAWFVKENLISFLQLPTWSSDWYLGTPILEGYPPLAAYLFAPLFLIFEPILATKLMTFSAHFLVVFTFFLLSLYVLRSKLLSLLATVVFSFSPQLMYRILGGPMAENTAFIFIPLLFLFLAIWANRQKALWLVLSAITLALVFLGHFSAGVFTSVAVAIFLLIHFVKNRKFFPSAFILLLGLSLPSFFFIIGFITKDEGNYAIMPYNPISPVEFGSLLFKACGNYGCQSWFGIGLYIGIMILIGALVALIAGKRTRVFSFIGFVFLIAAIFPQYFMPLELQKMVTFSVRLYSIVIVFFSLAAIEGFAIISKSIQKGLQLDAVFNLDVWRIVFVIFCFFVILDYNFALPRGDVLKVPEGVYSFYEKVANDREFYRIEDQAFFTFGFSPTLHKHGILNGGFMQMAPKYHFNFWSMSHQLPSTQTGAENYAKLYGSSSIKYFVLNGKISFPNWREDECGEGYCIYANEAFLPSIRLITVPANVNEADYYKSLMVVFGTLSEKRWDFAQAVFVRSPNAFKPASSLGSLEVLEKKPGFYKLKLSNTNGLQYVYVAESFFKGWKGRLNGRELAIFESIPSAMVIPVTEDGVLELRYDVAGLNPILANIFLAVSFISLLVIILLLALNVSELKESIKLIKSFLKQL